MRDRLLTFRFTKVSRLIQNTGHLRRTVLNDDQGGTQNHNSNRIQQESNDQREETPPEEKLDVSDDPVIVPDHRNDEQEEVAPEPPTDFQLISEAMDRLDLVPGEIVLLNEGGTKRTIWLLSERLIDLMDDIRNRTVLMKMLEKKCEVLESKYETGRDRLQILSDRFRNVFTQEEEHMLERELGEVGNANDEIFHQRAKIQGKLSDQRSEQSTAHYKIFLFMQQILADTGLLKPIPAISDDVEAEDEHPASSPHRARSPENPSHHSNSTVVSNDELFRRAACNKVEDLSKALERAEDKFDDREHAYNEHYDAWDQAMRDGNCSRTLTDVDLEYVQEISKRAREFREAETEYEAAVVTARRLKVLPIQYDQESNFVSRADDGYRESADAELCANVDRQFVERWADEVAEMAEVGPQAAAIGESELKDEVALGADEWDARSVGLSDSVSVVDISRNRKRIDRWRKICGW